MHILFLGNVTHPNSEKKKNMPACNILLANLLCEGNVQAKHCIHQIPRKTAGFSDRGEERKINKKIYSFLPDHFSEIRLVSDRAYARRTRGSSDFAGRRGWWHCAIGTQRAQQKQVNKTQNSIAMRIDTQWIKCHQVSRGHPKFCVHEVVRQKALFLCTGPCATKSSPNNASMCVSVGDGGICVHVKLREFWKPQISTMRRKWLVK